MPAFWVLDAEMATCWEIGIEKKIQKIPNRMQHHWKKLFDTKNLHLHKFGELSTSNPAHTPKPKIFSNRAVYIIEYLQANAPCCFVHK